jgi:hypothetical protein
MQLIVLIAQNLARRGHPDLSICSSAHGQGRLVPRRRQRDDLSLNVDPRYPHRSQHQNRTIGTRNHVQDCGRGHALVDSKSLEIVAGFAQQAIGSTNPKCIPRILRKATQIIASKRSLVGLCEDSKIQSIETREPAFCSDPEKAIARL